MTKNQQPADSPLQEQPFVSHLLELRDRLLRAVVVVAVVVVAVVVVAADPVAATEAAARAGPRAHRAAHGGACACATCHVYLQGDWAGKLYRPLSVGSGEPVSVTLVPHYAWGNRGDCERW